MFVSSRTLIALAACTLFLLRAAPDLWAERNVTMDGHSKDYIERMAEAEVVALRRALETFRALLEEFEADVIRGCEDPGSASLVLIHKTPLIGRNYWAVSEPYRDRFIGCSDDIYRLCDVGDLYWDIHRLLEPLNYDLGQPDGGQRNQTLVNIRYERIPGMYDRMDAIERRLCKRTSSDGSSPYDELTPEERHACCQRFTLLVEQLEELLRNTKMAVATSSVTVIEHEKGLVGFNLWRIVDRYRVPVDEQIEELYEYHSVTDRAGVPSGLHRILSYMKRNITGTVASDWGERNEDKRMSALLELRDEYLPAALAMLRAEQNVIENVAPPGPLKGELHLLGMRNLRENRWR